MQPGVLLPDPLWNLGLCRLDGFADAHLKAPLRDVSGWNGR